MRYRVILHKATNNVVAILPQMTFLGKIDCNDVQPDELTIQVISAERNPSLAQSIQSLQQITSWKKQESSLWSDYEVIEAEVNNE